MKTYEIFSVVRVTSPHPDWDDDKDDSEFEIALFEKEEDAKQEADRLGASWGDATHRAYKHVVRKRTVFQ